MRKRLHPATRQRGFTLLELLITTTVFSVALAAATPSISDWIKTNRLKSTAREVFSLFQKARLEAAKRNAPVSLSFISGNGSTAKCLAWIDDGGPDKGNLTFDSGETMLAEIFMPSGVSLSGEFNQDGQLKCGFNSRGLSINGRNGTIEIAGSAPNLNKIKIKLNQAGRIIMTKEEGS